MPTALLIGATGQVGQYVLKELLQSPDWTTVGEYGRKVTELQDFVSKHNLPSTSVEKIKQEKVDFEALLNEQDDGGSESQKFKGQAWDVVFITLGTSRKDAGSAEKFQKIDQEYVVRAAKAALDGSPAGQSPTLVYVSSVGADKNSSLLYARSKGETEERLSELGYKETIVFRPGALTGTARPQTRPVEAVIGFILPAISFISDSVGIKVADLAQGMLYAAKRGPSNLPKEARAYRSSSARPYTIIANAGSLGLSRLFNAEQTTDPTPVQQ
ncbi:hypothetical protein BDN72DRAFT_796945 [Pluteus cervinus]|uniref:Uncharacterized protein n=1 Tax=Pluteus cervinus TaxID=181527 RepID=A0ACD3ATY4_9AGAR|nr:hypothetical protein BDN72DRAFT_796945 [Pluteus cervinus]